MTRFLPLLPALVLTACAGMSKVDLWGVLTSGRDGWQHPERVVEALQLRPGDRVADIGAGDGYFLPWLSEAVGPDGRVYAVEVDDERVEELRAMADEHQLANVEHPSRVPQSRLGKVPPSLARESFPERP